MKVVIVSGPTATGKTDLAIELAQRFGGEVVNFDSLLLYREITVGTAKPSEAEMKGVPHHMINVRSISEPMNAADYGREALTLIKALESQRKNIYLVGGSGFYLQALLKGMYDSPTTPVEIQRISDELYKLEGIAPFAKLLRDHDPKSFERYHENDHYRIRRAVEHWWSTGNSFSEQRAKKDSANDSLRTTNVHGWETFHVYLDVPKEEHLRIIEARTDRMLRNGLVEEVKGLLAQGFLGTEKPLQAIGYKEVLDYHFGVYKKIEECRERIIISTRQLAKSQRTWFNRDQTKLKFHPLRDREVITSNLGVFLGK